MIQYEKFTNEFGTELIKKTYADGIVWFIPTDLNNSDFQAYLKYLEENK